ncbi:hypothetical protein SGPA1_50125 [Streptomyces misionensis JCM 4497]
MTGEAIPRPSGGARNFRPRFGAPGNGRSVSRGPLRPVPRRPLSGPPPTLTSDGNHVAVYRAALVRRGTRARLGGRAEQSPDLGEARRLQRAGRGLADLRRGAGPCLPGAGPRAPARHRCPL